MCAMDNFIWIYLHIHGECAIIKKHMEKHKKHANKKRTQCKKWEETGKN